MKALSLLCVFACVLSYTQEARAYFNSHINDLTYQIEPNQTTRSKPTSVKLASVSFLKTDKGIDFSTGSLDVKSQCGNLGYTIKTTNCTGDMKPSHLCSSDSSMTNVAGADQYTSGCCNSKIYTAETPEGCSDNSTALASDKCYFGNESKWKYRCACDRGVYPYSTISGEECSGNEFNESRTCQAYDPSTNKTETYYTGCCPSSEYKPCDGDLHQIGSGSSCQSSKDHKIKYENCVCAGHYDTICTNGKLIDVTNYCSLDNGVTKFTTESNCESNCTKTVETNVDESFYQKIWHCLYRKDGATVKNSENEDGLCGEYDASKDKGEYDECKKQGFVKSENDCYNKDVILRCPNDTSKVWCLEGKYCTGYDVGSHNGENYCTVGADVELCDASDQGTRCQYKNNNCNCAWNDGVLDYDAEAGIEASLTKCKTQLGTAQAIALFHSTTDDGNDLTCCKRGYKMQWGKCVKNVCDRDKYPYEQRPGDEMGTVEVCYEGDTTANLGYKAYFGYNDCKDNLALGGKWIKKGESGAEARQCICARNGELTAEINGVIEHSAKLPFSVELFFNSNADETDNYSHIGFDQGSYGAQVDCTDAEGSYYGYSSCFIGSKMLNKNDELTGKCIINPKNSSGYIRIPYSGEKAVSKTLAYANRILEAAELPRLTTHPARPVSENIPNRNMVYCINPSDHCPNSDPEQCDESVKPLLIEGCVHGWEEECGTQCYHKGILVKDSENAPYRLNDQGVKLMVNTYSNIYTGMGFETCPKGFIKVNVSYYNVCFKFCSNKQRNKCVRGDVLTLYEPEELHDNQGNALITLDNVDKNKVIGVVFAKDKDLGLSSNCGTSGKLHVTSIKYKNLKYDGTTMLPTAYPSSAEFQNAVGSAIYNIGTEEHETWRLFTQQEVHGNCISEPEVYMAQAALANLGGSTIIESWTDTIGVYRNCCTTTGGAISSNYKARPVITLAY